MHAPPGLIPVTDSKVYRFSVTQLSLSEGDIFKSLSLVYTSGLGYRYNRYWYVISHWHTHLAAARSEYHDTQAPSSSASLADIHPESSTYSRAMALALKFCWQRQDKFRNWGIVYQGFPEVTVSYFRPDANTKCGYHPFHVAAARGIMEIFLSAPPVPDWNIEDRNGHKPLDFAMRSMNGPSLQYLLSNPQVRLVTTDFDGTHPVCSIGILYGTPACSRRTHKGAHPACSSRTRIFNLLRNQEFHNTPLGLQVIRLILLRHDSSNLSMETLVDALASLNSDFDSSVPEGQDPVAPSAQILEVIGLLKTVIEQRKANEKIVRKRLW